jgi:O-6-methylguanine DNA methyltransferase
MRPSESTEGKEAAAGNSTERVVDGGRRSHPVLVAGRSQDGVLKQSLRGKSPRKAALAWPRSGWHQKFAKDLAAFLNGVCIDWSYVCINEDALSPFTREVVREMRRIPRGKVKTYGDIAVSLKKRGVKAAPRAVGQAVGRNPWALVVPCHRVVATGGIGGFGWGLKWKRRLLALEGVKI